MDTGNNSSQGSITNGQSRTIDDNGSFVWQNRPSLSNPSSYRTTKLRVKKAKVNNRNSKQLLIKNAAHNAIKANRKLNLKLRANVADGSNFQIQNVPYSTRLQQDQDKKLLSKLDESIASIQSSNAHLPDNISQFTDSNENSLPMIKEPAPQIMHNSKETLDQNENYL